jgi:DNA repair photolyase
VSEVPPPHQPAPRGRGTGLNPPNRFEPIEIEREEPGPDQVPTIYLRDTSRSIIATNNSPDVGFDASINPYRGCEHGCVYCLDGATPILMADGTTRPLANLRVGDAIYGTRRDGWFRRYVETRVLAHWETTKPAWAITLADGTRLVAGGDHRFLTERGWKFVTGSGRGDGCRPHLTTNDRLMGMGRTGNAIATKRPVAGVAVESSAPLGVRSIEPLGTLPLFDITTGTGDFIADGVVSHNCYARPTHEYFGLSAGLDFETRIFVKEEAPELLRRELGSPRWVPKVLAMSGVTDPYQPVERRLGLTRRCVEVLAEFRNPVAVVTKSRLVARDADLLGALAADGAAAVAVSITTLDGELAARMEPRAAHPRERLRAIEELAAAGVPVGVRVAPVVPAVTDHEMPRILQAAADAGAGFAGYVVLRLPWGIKDLFADWLEQHFPDRRQKVLSRLRELRGGALYDSSFGSRMRGEGVYAEQIATMFRTARRRAGLDRPRPELSTAAFRRPGEQRTLF